VITLKTNGTGNIRPDELARNEADVKAVLEWVGGPPTKGLACRAGLLLCSSTPLTACHQPSRPPPANITPMPSRAGQRCGFASGSLCASSGHSLSTTARISSEITVTFSISSMYLCNRRKSAGVMILPSTTRGE
jgi:hypothetical protein